ncbi:hypothetical protein D3C85_1516680 [compost metagenome]
MDHVANVRSNVVRCEALEAASVWILELCVANVYTACSFRIYGARRKGWSTYHRRKEGFPGLCGQALLLV